MFDETIVKILGSSYINTPIKIIRGDVQDYGASIKKEDYTYKTAKLMFVDYIEPSIKENSYLNIDDDIYKVIKIEEYSEHMEVYLFCCNFKDIKVNNVDKKVLIEETTEKINIFDEKIIVSDFQINTGDLVEYQGDNMKFKNKIISFILIIILIICGIGYYKLHTTIKNDLQRIKTLETNDENLKNDIFEAEQRSEDDKEELSLEKAEIEKYGSGGVSESTSKLAIGGRLYHVTNEQYMKDYHNYVFKKKLLDKKKSELSKNEDELNRLKKEVSRFKVFE